MKLLKITLPIALLFVVLSAVLITRKLIHDTLTPLKNLESEIKKTDPHALDNQSITLADALPEELYPLAKHYNHLLERISQVRSRERNFSAHAAHEMRTPLAGIHAILEQALKQQRTPESYAERIQESLTITQTMRELMNRLMHFSQLQSGTVPVHMSSFNLAAIIDQELSPLEERISSNKITLTKSISDMNIHNDETLVRIIIKNLLDNAVTYADPQTEIHIELQSNQTSNTLCISNHTSDLTRKDVETFFEAFYRKDIARSADSGHFGLGLALSYEIARSLGLHLHARLSEKQKISLTLNFPIIITQSDSSSSLGD